MAEYFGTNGIRGKFDLVNPEFALKASSAFAKWSGGKHKKIGIGRDMRLTSPAIHSACIAGVLCAGADAVDLGMVSSPTAEVMIRHLKLDGAIIVTASHNPPEWNALKFVDKNDIAISRERGEEIEKIMKEGVKHCTYENAGEYMQYSTASIQHMSLIRRRINSEAIQKKKPLIIVDCGNGTANLVAPALLRELGCEVKVINGEIDGKFPGRPSEPTEANLSELIAEVKKQKADLGIAYDGDSDRVIFICHKGNFIVGDRSFALSAKLALQKKKGTVVTTVATSNAVKDVCRQFGGTLHYTKVGAPYIAEEMFRINAVSGGEEVGGIVWPELSLAKDGFLAAVKLVEAICEKETSLLQMLNELPSYFNAKTKVEAPKGIAKAAVLGKVAKQADKADKITLLDGVRIDYKDSWAIIRASGTEDYFRIFAEAKSKKEAEELMKEHREMLEALLR
ncbi:phosphoglucosamine mutase [Candidatus Micrarchaeota archaeon CG11_big_fil_rev_8_21_14_0_20_47_5]|nr:MAG: phosphoglucosamine mutase [Candidatus Micrarchaeota archaeon CG1_02_47_40]PIN82592.1 MAG: phosphoglucosamine mutase [Candidatus Micrarchaeota archaeon CG11_big_fil_rev_8_21_14_0_20_47_5]